MKLIHTSDWHLGQNFHGYDRKEDHDHMIDQLEALVCSEAPDALLIAGDIFDVASPNSSVQKAFAEYIVRLHKACPEMTIVCISGNHDSAARHEIYQTPWEALNVHMLGKIDTEKLSESIISIPGKGYIAAVPYTNERYLNDEFYSKLEEAVQKRIAEDSANEPNTSASSLPIIYVGHAAIKGCNFSGHSQLGERFIGGIEYTSIEELGSIYDYVALGHIHKAQTFADGRARYSGSPVAVSFDEILSGYEHGFSIVEIGSHGQKARIRTQELICPNPLVNLPAEGYGRWEDVMGELKGFPADIPAYIRLNILLKDHELLPYDKENQIASALAGKKGRYTLINPTRELSSSVEQGEKQLGSITMEELQKINPLEVLESHARSEGELFCEEFKEMFDIVMSKIKEAEHEN